MAHAFRNWIKAKTMTIIKIIFLVLILTIGFVIGFSIPDHQQITSYASYTPDSVRQMLEEQTLVYSRLSRDYVEALELKNYMQQTVLDGKAYELTGDAYIHVFKNLPRENWYLSLNEGLAEQINNPNLTNVVNELKYTLMDYDGHEENDELVRLQFQLLDITKQFKVSCVYNSECNDNDMTTIDLCLGRVCFNTEEFDCFDSDYGQNFAERGTVLLINLSGYFNFVDNCRANNTILYEYFCNNSWPSKVELNCDCFGGACV